VGLNGSLALENQTYCGLNGSLALEIQTYFGIKWIISAEKLGLFWD
jgi:hypothetical protein